MSGTHPGDTWKAIRALTLTAAALLCIVLTIEQPLRPFAQVQAQSGMQTATLTVTDGYDTKLRKRLSEDGKVDTVQSSDDERWETDDEHFTAFQFTRPLPADAVIQSVKVMIEHYEENDISNGALRWEAGIGDFHGARPQRERTAADDAGDLGSDPDVRFADRVNEGAHQLAQAAGQGFEGALSTLG